MGRPPFNPGLVPSRAHSTWTTFNAREAKPLFSIALILLWTTVTLTREQESSAQIMVGLYYLSIISKSKTNSYRAKISKSGKRQKSFFAITSSKLFKN